jgi:hypothetical protein
VCGGAIKALFPSPQAFATADLSTVAKSLGSDLDQYCRVPPLTSNDSQPKSNSMISFEVQSIGQVAAMQSLSAWTPNIEQGIGLAYQTYVSANADRSCVLSAFESQYPNPTALQSLSADDIDAFIAQVRSKCPG